METNLLNICFGKINNKPSNVYIIDWLKIFLILKWVLKQLTILHKRCEWIFIIKI